MSKHKITKKSNPRRDAHIDDLTRLYRKHGLYDTKTPFEFRDDEHKKQFMADLRQLGHSHLQSSRCKCCNDDIIGA